MSENYLSPVGRLVQGDCFEPQTKDQQGAPRVIKTGPNAGQPNPQFFISVAFAKNDPAWPSFFAILDRVARASWPQLFPVPGGPPSNPKFAFKVIDGDGFDTNGKSNATKEGFAGHWVVRFTNGFPPQVFPLGHYLPHEKVTDRNLLRRGYYVRVAGNVVSNENPQNPGLFVNFNLVEIAGYGPEIVSGPDAAQVFGGTPMAALPPGASATPVGAPPQSPGYPAAPAPMAAPAGYPATPPAPAAPAGYPAAPAPMAAPAGYPGAPAPMAAPAGYPGAPAAPGGYPAPLGVGTPSPATGYPSSPPPPMPAPAPEPVGPQLTPHAATAYPGVTYEGFIAGGWTDETMRAHGIIA